jgi:hypothetical protein
MEPVSRLSRMMGLIRSGQAGKTREGKATSHAGSATPGKTRTNAAASRQGVRELVIAGIDGIDFDTDQGRQRGIRVFLEAVFRDELGEGLMGSPRFNDIVGEVQAVLSDDAVTRAELIELLRGMQAKP